MAQKNLSAYPYTRMAPERLAASAEAVKHPVQSQRIRPPAWRRVDRPPDADDSPAPSSPTPADPPHPLAATATPASPHPAAWAKTAATVFEYRQSAATEAKATAVLQRQPATAATVALDLPMTQHLEQQQGAAAVAVVVRKPEQAAQAQMAQV